MKRKIKLSPVGGSKENSVASALSVIGVVVFVSGIILGLFIMRTSVLIGVGIILQEFAVGMVICGVASAIEFAQLGATRQYVGEIIEESDEKNNKNASGLRSANNETKSHAAAVHNNAADGVDKTGREAHFSTRPAEHLCCPICGKEQNSKRSRCMECGAKFVFDDETPEA